MLSANYERNIQLTKALTRNIQLTKALQNFDKTKMRQLRVAATRATNNDFCGSLFDPFYVCPQQADSLRLGCCNVIIHQFYFICVVHFSFQYMYYLLFIKTCYLSCIFSLY